jgi:hypothetical protein
MQAAAKHAVTRCLAVRLPLFRPITAVVQAAGQARKQKQHVFCNAMGKASTSLSKRLHVYVSGERCTQLLCLLSAAMLCTAGQPHLQAHSSCTCKMLLLNSNQNFYSWS